MYKFSTKISGNSYTVVKIPVITADVKPDLSPIHHIFILDRSGSMRSSIDGLIDNVQTIFNSYISDNRYITIIWYSSPGECRTLVKMATVSNNISALLNSIRSTLGTTCFSDPLVEVEKIIEEAKSLNPRTSISLFTDGCPVVPWSIEDEYKLVFSSLEKIKPFITSIDTIGYGNYYNAEFLQKIADTTSFGKMYHTYNIDQYYQALSKGLDVNVDLIPNPVKVVAPESILYSSPILRSLVNLELDIKHSGSDSVIYIILSDKLSKSFVYNNTIYDISSIKTDVVDQNFFYLYAAESYYRGDRRKALDILVSNLKDKRLADSVMNSFTRDEVADTYSLLSCAATDESYRFLDGKCSPTYAPPRNAYCVMDLINELTSDDVRYFPFSDNVPSYSRITAQVIDDYNQFTPVFPEGKSEFKVPFNDLVPNKDRANYSIRFKIPGVVTLNPKSARAVNLPDTIEVHKYNAHTLIKDGNLNIVKGEFEIPSSLYSSLLGKSKKQLVKLIKAVDPETSRVIINFSAIPIINKSYLEDVSLKDIHDAVSEMAVLEVRQKIVNHFLKEVESLMPPSKVKKDKVFTKLTLPQIKVLEEHGITKDLTYSGIDNKTVKTGDSYETRDFSFYLKGFTSIPTISKVIEEADKPTKSKVTIFTRNEVSNIVEFMKSLSIDEQYAYLVSSKSAIKQSLKHLRYLLGRVCVAKLLNNDWFVGLNEDFEYTDSSSGDTIVARTNRVTEYI